MMIAAAFLAAALAAQPVGAVRVGMVPLARLLCPTGEPKFVPRDGYQIVICEE